MNIIEPMTVSAETDNLLAILNRIERDIQIRCGVIEKWPMKYQQAASFESRVRRAEREIHMHIMPIILNHLISNGYAPLVIKNGTATTAQG